MKKIFGMALAVLLLGNSVEAAQVQGNLAGVRADDSSVEVSADTYEAYYSRGFAYFKDGKSQLAAEEFEKALVLDSENANNIEIYVALGECYCRFYKNKEALGALNKALDLVPSDDKARLIQVYRLRGRAYEQMKEYESALADINKAIEISAGRELSLYYQLATTHQKAGNKEAAFKSYTKAIELEPENSEHYRARSGGYKNEGEYELALADLDKVIEKSSQPSAKDYCDRAMLLLVTQRNERFEEGIQSLSKAIEIDPNYEWAYEMRSDFYRVVMRYDLALADLDILIKKTPHHWRRAHYYDKRAEVFLASGDNEGALKEYSKAAEASPKSDYAHSKRIRIFEEMKRYDLAIAEVDIVIKKVSTPSEKAEYYHRRGRLLEENGDDIGALKGYSKAIELQPKSGWNYEWLLRSRIGIYRKMKKYDLALQDIDLMMEQSSTLKAYHYRLRGDILEESGNLEEALIAATKAIEISPKDSSNYSTRISIYRKMKKYNLALVDADVMIAERLASGGLGYMPGYAHLLKGEILEEVGDKEGAIREYSKAIELNPSHIHAYKLRAILYHDAKKYDLALADIHVVINKISLPSAENYWLRGSILEALGDRKGAIQDFARAVEIDPTYLLAYQSRFGNYEITGNPDLMRSMVDSLIKHVLYPWDKSLEYYQRGNIWMRVGDYEEAFKEYTRAIEINPNNISAYEKRSRVYVKMEKYGLALADINTMIKRAPSSNSNHYVLRGRVLLKSGDEKGALKEYARAIKMNESDLLAYFERAEIYEKQGKYDLALADCTLLVLKKPEAPGWHYRRAEIYYRMGDKESATKGFEKALELSPEFPRSAYRLGKIYENYFEEKETASTYYHLALKGTHPELEKEIIQKAEEAIQRLEGQ